jgi:hypothetical protein
MYHWLKHAAVFFLIFVCYEALNIYMPSLFPDVQVGDNMVHCKQQSVQDEQILEDLYAYILSYMPGDLLDIGDC